MEEASEYKCDSFVGRQELIEVIVDLVKAPHREVKEQRYMDPVYCFLGICVGIFGVSGAGKTALMTKTASLLHNLFKGVMAVIIRFCGTSAGSNNARSLMI